MVVRKIIFLSVGEQPSLCQLSAKFSPINRILSSSSEDSDHRFPLRLDNRCLVVSTSSSFSFQRRSNSPATRRFLASTASYPRHSIPPVPSDWLPPPTARSLS